MCLVMCIAQNNKVAFDASYSSSIRVLRTPLLLHAEPLNIDKSENDRVQHMHHVRMDLEVRVLFGANDAEAPPVRPR